MSGYTIEAYSPHCLPTNEDWPIAWLHDPHGPIRTVVECSCCHDRALWLCRVPLAFDGVRTDHDLGLRVTRAAAQLCLTRALLPWTEVIA